MFQEVLKHYPHLGLNVVGLLIFFTVFLGILAWVMRGGSTAVYGEIEQLPLDLNASSSGHSESPRT